VPSVPISPQSAFWYAASSVRDPAALDRTRRRALTILAVLALRRDRIGSQAMAILSGIRLSSCRLSLELDNTALAG
jgi:hypothetical protein